MIRKIVVNKSGNVEQNFPNNKARLVIIHHHKDMMNKELCRIHDELSMTEKTLQTFLNKMDKQNQK